MHLRLRLHLLATLLLTTATQPGLAVASTRDEGLPLPGGLAAECLHPDRAHQSALADARAGDFARALPKLKDLITCFPRQTRFRNDWITALSWAGRHREALTEADGLAPGGLPGYTLVALAQSARATGAPDRALGFLAQLEHRSPLSTESQLLRMHILIDAGRASEVVPQIHPLLAAYPDHQDVLTVAARAYESTRRWMDALDTAQSLLARLPHDAPAQRLYFQALWRLGAPHLAGSVAPADLDDATRARLKQDQLAFEIRWGRVTAQQSSDPARWRGLDHAIDELRALAADLEGRGATRLARLVRHDLVVALAERIHTEAAITAYESPELRTAPTPAYVDIAAATAYLHERHPDIAARLLGQALGSSPRAGLNTQLSYYYALLENEEYDQALAHLDQVREPEWLHPRNPDLRQPNDAYPRLLVSQALARAYTGRLAAAQARMEELKRRAPANADIRNALASVYQMRGWPRRAEADLEWLRGVDPDLVWSQLGLYGARLNMGEFEQARQDLDKAAATLPEEPAVRRARHEWRTHESRQVVAEASSSRSDESDSLGLAGREQRLAVTAYSRPIAYRWRLAAHARRDSALLGRDRITRRAVGLGAEYRSRTLDADITMHALHRRGVSVAAAAAYLPDDYWRLEVHVGDRLIDAPLRAYRDGIDARAIGVTVQHRWHESRSARVSVEAQRFSDGNRRLSQSASWQERLISGPRLTLDLLGGVYASTNSLAAAAAPYYNPSRDRSATVTLRSEWTQFRRYESSLTHRLDLEAGRYWQAGQGSDRIQSLRYVLAWAPDDRSELRLALGYLERPYDGVQTSQQDISLLMNLRF